MEQKALLDEIAEKLLTLQDPETGQRSSQMCTERNRFTVGLTLIRLRTSSSATIEDTGLLPRVCWEVFPETVLEENTNQWRGDHLIDAQHVPGILCRIERSGNRLPPFAMWHLPFFPNSRSPGLTS